MGSPALARLVNVCIGLVNKELYPAKFNLPVVEAVHLLEEASTKLECPPVVGTLFFLSIS